MNYVVRVRILMAASAAFVTGPLVLVVFTIAVLALSHPHSLLGAVLLLGYLVETPATSVRLFGFNLAFCFFVLPVLHVVLPRGYWTQRFGLAIGGAVCAAILGVPALQAVDFLIWPMACLGLAAGGVFGHVVSGLGNDDQPDAP